MSKLACFRGIWLTFFMLFIIGMVNARWLEGGPYLVTSSSSSSSSMISDGIDEMNYENTVPNLAEERCTSIYGVLPCANTMAEGVFLMINYTYLMMLGEEWIREGSQGLFLLLGDKKIGASVFRVLMALPRLIIVIASGVVCTADAAQNQVAFGMSMYAGSSVITLTLIWGLRVILSQNKLRGKGSMLESEHQEDPSTTCLSLKHKLSILNDNGVNIDKETGDIARIMLLSLIPFVTVELVSITKSPTAILFALIVSCLSLILYFGYQIWSPWIQVRSMAYLKQENLRARFFYHVRKLADDDNLSNDDGSPNISVFKRIFEKTDKDNDNCISHEELETLIRETFELEKDSIPTEYAKVEILTHFDRDNSGKINLSEFLNGCTKWFEKWNSSGSNSKNLWKRVEEVSIRKRRAKITNIERIMPRVLRQVLAEHNLVTENGEPNKDEIEKLFSDNDENNDNDINRIELKKFIAKLHFGITMDDDRVLDELVKDFNSNGTNDKIEKKEFVEGFAKWIKKAIDHDPTIKNPKKAIEKFDKDIWEESDAPTGKAKPITISIMYVISGLVVMSLISSAFIQSVIQFSNAARVPFYLTSFVMAPLAMNTRMVIKAVLNHQAQLMNNPSLTFSEMYSGLVMNNLVGLSTLLAIVCIRGLSWTYSSEVLSIMLPCLIVGLFGLKRETYPLWASIFAMLLYPIEIYLFHVLYHQ